MSVRLATPADAAAVAAIYALVVRETAISFEVDPPAFQGRPRRSARQPSSASAKAPARLRP